MIHNSKFKILIIVGPTSSGKSELAALLAKKFNGEIISCDSRQIYKGMDLGTGKVAGKWQRLPIASHPERSEGSAKKCFIYKTVPHHLIDFVNPKRQYSAALFQHDAKKIIAGILARGNLPILCGGTAHWIDAVVFDQRLPDVKPNAKLRRQLESLSTECLFARISRLDPKRAKTIDKHNRRRLIRALEIILTTGKPVPSLSPIPLALSPYNPLWLGINPPRNILFAKIKKRLKQRLNAGMIAEVKRLHQYSPPQNMGRVPRLPAVALAEAGVHPRGERGLSYKRLQSFGLEYKFVSLYLQKKLNYDEMFEQLLTAIKQYSKRQMTWWKRNKEIRWITDLSEAQKLTTKFL